MMKPQIEQLHVNWILKWGLELDYVGIASTDQLRAAGSRVEDRYWDLPDLPHYKRAGMQAIALNQDYTDLLTDSPLLRVQG